MYRVSQWTFSTLLAVLCLLPARATAAPPAGPLWHTDYAQALAAAKQQAKMLVVFFYAPGENRLRAHFESRALADAAVQEKLRECVCLKLPLDATICLDGKDVSLLKHAAFKKLRGSEGLAILDYAHPDASYFASVVSVFPFVDGCCYSARQMALILDLPPGTLKQRKAEYLACVRGKPGAPEKNAPHEEHASSTDVVWLHDYDAARRIAEKQEKMLLIHFCDAAKDQLCRRFQAEVLADPAVRAKLRNYVCARLPLDAKCEVDGDRVRLLGRSEFKEMLGRPGVAIVDFAHRDAKYYGHAVSLFPLTPKLRYTPKQMCTILDLPPGTLTQRTLIYAVRIHPEAPASTVGKADNNLLLEAEKHSKHQADIRLQGHHSWDSRFQQINAKLPGGLTAIEVCAESWPGENLVEAAIECVHSWRQSSGHWSAVRQRHRVFGYDMKRGSNGIWYATGIFGRG
jgi:hypothetical protein